MAGDIHQVFFFQLLVYVPPHMSFISAMLSNINLVGQATTPLGMILRLYAAGLKIFSKLPRGETHDSAFSILVDDGESMQGLANLNGYLGSYFRIGCREGNESCSIKQKDFVQPCSHWNSNHEFEVTSLSRRRETYLPSYLDAIKFLCQPLAELVNSERKKILAEDEAASVLYNIQNTLHQYCDVFLFCQRQVIFIFESVSFIILSMRFVVLVQKKKITIPFALLIDRLLFQIFYVTYVELYAFG